MAILRCAIGDLAEVLASPVSFGGSERGLKWPLIAVDLSDRIPDLSLICDLATLVSAHVALVVGVSSGEPDEVLRPLLRAMTFTLTEVNITDPWFVTVSDLEAGLALVGEQVSSAPFASLALGNLLRQTSVLPLWQGLLSEAATYSMLLSGSEFAAWKSRRPRPRSKSSGLRDSAIAVNRDGGIMHIRLARPEVRNAYNVKMRSELLDALEVAIIDESVESINLRGEGPDFCAGGDLSEFGSTSNVLEAYLVRLTQSVGWKLHLLNPRLAVYVHGHSVGAGVELAAFSSRVIATPSSSFALPEISMGLIPGAGGTVSVTSRIGRWRMGWLALTGTTLSCDVALDWGLVDQIEYSS